MKTKFAIGIPTINRGNDLLFPSLFLYVTKDFPNTDIYIIDNGNQNLKAKIKNLKNVYLIEEDNNLGVSASWNKLCGIIFKNYEYAFILNDDIYLGYGENIVEQEIKKYKSALVQAQSTWAAFLISKSIFNKVGDFEESFFPAYFEDNDYVYRMKLLNIAVISSFKLMPTIMRESSSSNKDTSLIKNFSKNKGIYIEKWGGEVGKEKFKRPYNANI